jgi:hypothetical protein
MIKIKEFSLKSYENMQSCFQPLKNRLKISFHSNDKALELTKSN